MTATASLTSDQAQRIDRAARAVLAEPAACELGDMADRIGRLEWHLAGLVALVRRAGCSLVS
jgi:hypothetical protein